MKCIQHEGKSVVAEGFIKMKPIDVTSDSYAEYNESSNKKDPKFMIVLGCQNTKIFLLKDTLKSGQK